LGPVLQAYDKLAYAELVSMPVFPPGPKIPRSRWWKYKYRWRRRVWDWLSTLIDWLEEVRQSVL
ncbi:hypothetical protein LCGC14_1692910, partial [marine sediment metagenome]